MCKRTHGLGGVGCGHKEQSWLEKSSHVFGNSTRAARKGAVQTPQEPPSTASIALSLQLEGAFQNEMLVIQPGYDFPDLCNSSSQGRRQIIMCWIPNPTPNFVLATVSRDVLPEGKPSISEK